MSVIVGGFNLGWKHGWQVQSPLTNAQAFAFKKSSDHLSKRSK